MNRTSSDRREASSGFETPSVPTPSTAVSDGLDHPVIDQYAMDRIDYRVRELTACFDLSQDEQDELRNDMVVEVLQAFPRFDPDKAKRETFINRVLDRFVKYMKRVRCTRMRRAWESPLGLDDVHAGFAPVVNDPRRGEPDEQALRELRIDVRDRLDRMPEKLRHVAEVLMTRSGRQAMRELHVGKTTLYRYIARIRQYFVDGDEQENPAEGGTLSPRLQM